MKNLPQLGLLYIGLTSLCAATTTLVCLTLTLNRYFKLPGGELLQQ